MAVGPLILICLLFQVKGIVEDNPRDTNPSIYMMDYERGKLEILNEKGEKLWQFPVNNEPDVRIDETIRNLHHTCIADLNGDGKNEIITVLSMPSFNEDSTQRTLRIFDSNNRLIYQRDFNRVSGGYLKRHFESSFGMLSLSIVNTEPTGAKEIVVAANDSHSVSFLARFDASGNLLGRYWHFGQLEQYAMDLNGDGKDEIILTGRNEVSENKRNGFPVIIVLDPSRITGNCESSCTRGFGFPRAKAEIFYVRLIESDLDKALNGRACVTRLEQLPKDKLGFLEGSVTGTLLDNFEYILSCTMRILDVRATAGGRALHLQLKRQGRVRSTLNGDYLDALRREAIYWNGQSWVNQPTKVHARRHAQRSLD